MKSLFHISQDLLTLLADIEAADGVLSEDQEHALTIHEGELAQKSENYIHAIRKLEAEIQLAKDYEAQAKAYRARKEKSVKRLKDFLAFAVLQFGKIETGIHTVSVRKSQAVFLQDETEIPESFKTYQPKIDKSSIRKALLNGESVPGAELVQNESLQIR